MDSEAFLLRILALSGLAVVTFTLGSLAPAPIVLRPDTSRAALASLGEEYGELQQWAAAILAATDTLQPASAERARALADQLARVISPLEGDFENTTAALSTNQLDLVLPLWERMAFAHAGLVMLQERAAALGQDPAMAPAELHDLAFQLSAVLGFAEEIQRMVLDQLTLPVDTSIRTL
ncbi:MAG TPA: hypothetical protein VK899_03120 [Gemmatimonadales bacterium]|nr:hypothetical protein [Gemmatimonadales bacterium]